MPRKYTISPEAAHERARKARAAQLSVKHYVQKIVERAPELTDADYAKLRTIGLRLDGGATE
ncbi:hypothetical protein [Streptomyces sp. NPDC050548]|uniref:hypothetical protein n=1 Tax=Streptomyces sp. NPDC050548 TaxID=3365629 RepID=UPI0037BD481E